MKLNYLRRIGIDLGSFSTVFYTLEHGVILDEPSLVAVDSYTRRPIAFGKQAYAMLGREPKSIALISPFSRGEIADFQMLQAMLGHFFKQINERFDLGLPLNLSTSVLLPFSVGARELEFRAIIRSFQCLGIKNFQIVNESVAAAIGSNLFIDSPSANLVIDIGHSSTKIAAVSIGRIILGDSIQIGGHDINRAIIRHVKEVHDLVIGQRTASDIKEKLNCFQDIENNYQIELKGNHILGLPKIIYVNSAEFRKPVLRILHPVIELVKKIIGSLTPEIVSDLVESGVLVTGGSSSLQGFDSFIAHNINLPVHISNNPIHCVAQGCVQSLEYQRDEFLKKQLIFH